MLEDGFLPATSRHTLWLLCGHGTAKAICSHRGATPPMCTARSDTQSVRGRAADHSGPG